MSCEAAYSILESSEQAPTPEALVVRETDTYTIDGPALLALDVQAQRHLLIPHPMKIRAWAEGSLAYSSRELGEVPRTYLDLTCTQPQLNTVFSSFADHVLAQLSPVADALVAVRRSVDDWKQLFRSQSGLAVQEAIGLIGELVILERFAKVSPGQAWEAWKGPNGGVHDFMTPTADLEVKCTSALDGGGLVVHGLDQLDPHSRPLHLVVHRVHDDPSAPMLDERLDHLARLGIPKFDLLEIASAMGHEYRSGRSPDEHRFRVTHTKCYRVCDEFPGLRRSRLDQELLHGVSRVRYTLALDSLPAQDSSESLDAIIRSMTI